MMKKNSHYYIRRSHRYLGLFVGLRFLLWTVGGLYFSWSKLNNIHGDHLTNRVTGTALSADLVSPQQVIEKLAPVDSLRSLQLIQVLDSPVYQLRYYTRSGSQSILKTQLASARTGNLRPPLSQGEAAKIAQQVFSVPAQIASAEYLEATGPHDEYREKPLPAWAITFRHPSEATVYVAAELGTYQSIRHERWRVFNFLCMLHTIGYDGDEESKKLKHDEKTQTSYQRHDLLPLRDGHSSGNEKAKGQGSAHPARLRYRRSAYQCRFETDC